MDRTDSSNQRPLGKFTYLLGSLLALLIVAAFIGSDPVSVTIFCLLVAVVLLTAVVSACRRHRTLGLGLVLAIPVVVLNVAGYVTGNVMVFVIHNMTITVFFAFVSYHLLCAVLDDRQVTLDTIVGAVCLYLLAGLLWTYLYSTIILLSPSAFQLATAVDPPRASPFGNAGFQQLVYLSFVTMTTLGYGDITPVSAPAQTASYFQAVFGQLFLVVFVARLVALHIAVAKRRQGNT
ncbi:MAG: two pore domain potassium channel family protein [Planctomycetota bacterium]|nr:MAG: two pore domain potassium channel family protein [Planctomycetota bacterium]REJ92132.1 MAG: two pore domain potassium channel family protein [Planctomycetota bacterium]REK28668.1 MAG: two pore domain potassium channel family protein [Planctomycetota bacterium]REK39282.1 MAG: two pore domain potassium channel family protein [Planctomycetota bacterium]